MATEEPKLRLARLDEADAVDALMKASIAAIFPRFYDEAQTQASVRYIAVSYTHLTLPTICSV